MIQENWKIIDGFKNYQVSNFGNVKSFARGRPKLLKQSYHKDYMVVSLNGKYKVVHRLVAEAFIPNTNNLALVDHKDGDRKNNNFKNLRWVSFSENSKNTNTRRILNYPSFNQIEFECEKWVSIPYSFFNKNDLQVSNLGRVKNQNFYGKEKFYLFGASEKNYCEIKLNGKRFKIHRLVWLCFKGSIPEGLQINHKDNDKTNNRIVNLELLTASDNIKHNYTTNNITKSNFFSENRIEKIINSFYIDRKSSVEISYEFRCGTNDVLDIIKGTKVRMNEFVRYYDNYEIYKKISYYWGRIKQIKGSKSFEHFESVWELKNKGITYKGASTKLGIDIDTIRTCYRAKIKIDNNLKKIKILESKILESIST